MNTLLRFGRPFVVALLLTSGACGILRVFTGDAPKRPFSHKQHGRAQELECKNCHSKAEKADEAGMPANLKRCMLCHEGQDETKPPERKLAALVGEKPEWTNVTALVEDVKFSHQIHLRANVTCAECHVGIEDNESITEAVRMSKDACLKCHGERGAGGDCSVCHTAISKEVPPATHDRNWKRMHGEAVKWGETPPYTNRCSLCHAQASCVACHQEEAPQNHTNFWRIQGHAVAVQIDRSSCATCHRSDFCDRCHEETAPRSHTATWGSSQDRHCLSCHLPLRSEGCVTCHKSTPSHDLATPMPAWHNSGMNCRACHGEGLAQPLPHPDTGDTCTTCHR